MATENTSVILLTKKSKIRIIIATILLSLGIVFIWWTGYEMTRSDGEKKTTEQKKTVVSKTVTTKKRKVTSTEKKQALPPKELVVYYQDCPKKSDLSELFQYYFSGKHEFIPTKVKRHGKYKNVYVIYGKMEGCDEVIFAVEKKEYLRYRAKILKAMRNRTPLPYRHVDFLGDLMDRHDTLMTFIAYVIFVGLLWLLIYYPLCLFTRTFDDEMWRLKDVMFDLDFKLGAYEEGEYEFLDSSFDPEEYRKNLKKCRRVYKLYKALYFVFNGLRAIIKAIVIIGAVITVIYVVLMLIMMMRAAASSSRNLDV